MDESLKAWFLREILPHEAALVRYLNRIWPNRHEVHDLRQDIYVKVFEAAAVQRPHSPKSFLFATARHLMADRVRRRRIISIDTVGDLDALNVLVNEISPEQQMGAGQDLRRLTLAFDALGPKCREVVWMRRVEDLSQNEVAARLSISPRTVEKHVLKGMVQLADAFLGRTPQSKLAEHGDDTEESEHGNQQTD